MLEKEISLKNGESAVTIKEKNHKLGGGAHGTYVGASSDGGKAVSG